jgi:excisionase family DNA binding protein
MSKSPPQIPATRWYGYADAAQYLSVSERQLHRWVSQGRIAYCRMGLRINFSRQMLDDFEVACTFTPEAES